MPGRIDLVAPLYVPALLAVLLRARQVDRDDYRSLTGSDIVPAQEAPFLVQSSRVGAVFFDAAGRPQAAAGAIPSDTMPWVSSLWLHATDCWGAVWRTALRWIVRVAAPEMRAAGVRRVQAFAVHDRPEAVRFLRACGLRPEGLMKRFAADGSNVRMMAGFP